MRARLAYHPEQWIAEVAARRLRDYAADIRRADEIVLEPDPLIPTDKLKRRSNVRRPDRVFGRDDYRGDTVLDCDVVVVGSGAGGASDRRRAGRGRLRRDRPRGGQLLPDARLHRRRVARWSASCTATAAPTMALGNPPMLFSGGPRGRRLDGDQRRHVVAHAGEDPRALAQGRRGSTHHRAKEMEPYFERVERRIHVAPTGSARPIGNDNELLKKGADTKGWEIIGNMRNQAHCAGSNHCAFGCPTGAKQIGAGQLHAARARTSARASTPTCGSRSSSGHGKRATGVRGRVGRADGNALGARVDGAREAHRARRAARSTRRRCSMRSGIRSPSGRIGHNLSLHPNVKVQSRSSTRTSRAGRARTRPTRCASSRTQGFVFAAVNMPPGVLAMTVPHRGARARRADAQLHHMVLAGMLREDTATGRVRTVGGRPQAFYQLADHDAGERARGISLLSRAAVRGRREADRARRSTACPISARPTTCAGCSSTECRRARWRWSPFT